MTCPWSLEDAKAGARSLLGKIKPGQAATLAVSCCPTDNGTVHGPLGPKGDPLLASQSSHFMNDPTQESARRPSEVPQRGDPGAETGLSDQAEEALTHIQRKRRERFQLGGPRTCKGSPLETLISTRHVPPRGHQPQVITVPGQLDIPGPSCILSAHGEGPKAVANE